MSVWIQTRPSGSIQMPSGEPNSDWSVGHGGVVARVSREQEDVPVEAGLGEVAALLAEAHDVAVGVGVAVAVDGAVVAGAVGQRHVHVIGVRVHGDPLGAVQARGTDGVGGAARAQQHVGLIDPAVRHRERAHPVFERQPRTGTVVAELRHVERAVVERALAPRAQQAPGRVAHELVQVLAVLVVAAVDHDAALALHHGRTLVLEAAERRALDGRGLGIEGIDLHDPTEVVGLIAR